ncbi:MAG TPA: glycosyltransferase family 4 protein [Caulobacteraceae bacterium]
MTDAFGGRGGIAQYNRDMAIALANGPFDAVEILPRVAPHALDTPAQKVRQHAPRPGRFAYVLAAIDLAWRLRPETIFCGHLFMAPLGLALARLVKARLVVQTHGVEAWARPLTLQRLAAERADLILAVSRDTRSRVLAWAAIGPERVRVASNTVAEDFTPGDGRAMRATLGLTDEFVILTVGRLATRERYKGHDRIIRLIPRMMQTGLRPAYLIAGDGDDGPRLAAIARECGVGDQVRFLGHVTRETLPDLYRAAQLFLLPSTGEGFGIAFLEAMACGTPAVGLARGGAMDALCDGELGVALSPDDMCDGLLRTCCDLRAGLLETGKPLARRVDERFGHAAFERRINRLFAEDHPD